MRSIKQIGFVLLLALWFPGLFAHGTGFQTRTAFEPATKAAFIQASSCEAAPFHQLRLQKSSGGATPGVSNPGWLCEGPAQEEQSSCHPNCFLAALPANPTAHHWHILNPTELPRAPSL